MVDVSTDHGATRFGGRLATLVAACTALGLGWTTGNLPGVAAGLIGAVCIALGANGLQSDANERRAAGSFGIVAGAVALSACTQFGSPPLFVLLLSLGVTAVAVNATSPLSSTLGYPLYLMFRRSIAVLFVGLVLAGGIYAGVFRTLGWLSGSIVVSVVASSDLARLIGLQIGCLVVVELLHFVVPILDKWLPEEKVLRRQVLEPFGFRLETVPVAYWTFLGMQVIVAFSAWGPPFFDSLLTSLSLFGDVIRTVLRSGVLHVPIALLFLFELTVLLARGIQHAALEWMGGEPPQTLAFATGGIVVVAVAAVLGVASSLVPWFGSAVASAEPGQLVEQFGPASTLIGAIGSVLIGLVLVQIAVVLFVRPWVALDSASGFAFGGAALFLGALAAAELGATPVVVFCGVAAALVVRDVGDHAAEINLQIGRGAETRRGEIAHATGVLLVGGIGVGLAVAALSFVGPISLPTSVWRGYLALALLLVSVVSFALLLGNE